jgi:hypothetical protein
MPNLSRILPLTLFFFVILFSCQKKESSDEVITSNYTSSSTSNYTSSLVAPTNPVIASEPPASITGDLTVTFIDAVGKAQIFTIATQSEYNSLDYEERIFTTGIKHAAEYLAQMSISDSTALQFNADNTYSVLLNPTTTTGLATQSCRLCVGGGSNSLKDCIRTLKKYMDQTGQTSIKPTVKIEVGGMGNLCMVMVYKYSTISLPAIITSADGILAMKFTPAITFGDIYYQKYILWVRGWVLDQTTDPIDGGAITDPNTWSRQRLVQYLRLFNSNTSHPVKNNQTNDVFQGQLKYYIYDLY